MSMKAKAWTNAELISALKKLPLTHKVLTEGCDCYGKVIEVHIYGSKEGEEGSSHYDRKVFIDRMRDSEDAEHLTNEQLIARLSNLPSTAEVVTEGCDCYGDAAGARLEIECGEEMILIERSDG